MRSASPRSASARPWPICISRSTRENSSASGPSVLRPTCCTAASKARPDSTLIVIRSMASGRSRCIRLRAVVDASGRGTGWGRTSRPRCRTDDEHACGAVKPAPITAVRASEIRNSAIAPITLPAWTRSTVQPDGVAGDVEPVADPLGGVAARTAGARPSRARAWSGRHDPVGERLVVLLGELLGRVGQRLHQGDGAVDAADGLPGGGGAHGGRDQDDREHHERAAEDQEHGHVTPRP